MIREHVTPSAVRIGLSKIRIGGTGVGLGRQWRMGRVAEPVEVRVVRCCYVTG
jgi:hypothetical protein